VDTIPELRAQKTAQAGMSGSRGRGSLVAFAYPCATFVAAALWISSNGWELRAPLPIVAFLIVLASLSERIEMIIGPRAQVSVAAGFIAAAALAGGPLAGALAGASTEALTAGAVWRKRFAWAGACALQGFGIGVVSSRLPTQASGEMAFEVAGAGLAVGLAINLLNLVTVGLDRRIDLRTELAASWRATALEWALPWPVLAAFLFASRRAPTLAVALAAGLFAAVWIGNRVRLRLEHSLADERLRSRTDALTGAPNRYALAEALAAEHARIMRGGRPGALCFIDLDRFREVNNTYGYSAGDELLVRMYERFRKHLRVSDQLFRWGGEEFVVIAPDEPDLAGFAERLRRVFADEPFAVSGRQLALTGSVGAALLDETRTPEAALKTASRLVRVAKEKRNTVEVEFVTANAALGAAQALAEF